MASLREAWLRLVSFFRGDSDERSFEEELIEHIRLATEANLRQGMSMSEAKRQALIKLGGVESSRQLHRDTRGLPWLDGVAQDVRHALRSVRRSPMFVGTAVLMLGVALGVNTAFFTVMQAVLFRGFPGVEGNDRILYVTGPRGEGDLSYPDFADWRQQATAFQGLGAVADLKVALSDPTGSVERADVTVITPNGFQVLGVGAFLGRTFLASDQLSGPAEVAILSYAFWQRRYAGDTAIVGRSITLDRRRVTIVGVMPAGFSFPQKVDVWVPPAATPDTQRREARGVWFAFGRLRDGATREQATAELAAIARRLALEYPASNIPDAPHVLAFDELFIGPQARLMYWALFGAVTLVLLIACANLTNLMLSRALGRTGEVSLRIAVGASGSRIARQLLIESLIVSALGALAGWWVAVLSIRFYERLSPPPEWFAGVMDYGINGRVAVYLGAICVTTGLLAGVLPALRLSRLHTAAVLKDNSRTAAGSIRSRRLSAVLVAGEMALAIVLLAGAGVMLRSFANVYKTKLGIDSENVVIAFLNLPNERYPDTARRRIFFDRLVGQVAAKPGVQSAAVASSYPTGGTGGRPFEVPEAPSTLAPRDPRRPRVGVMAISSGYFAAVGARLERGRDFSAADESDTLRVAIVNEQFAGQQWPGQSPIGKRFRLLTPAGPGEWLTIVGLAPNIVQNSLDPTRIESLVYLPYAQGPRDAMWVLARTTVMPESLFPVIRREVQALDGELPVWLGPFTLSERLGRLYSDKARYGVLLLILATVALLLAAAGLYAVTAHAVSQRTREFGIRVAVGAQSGDVLRSVLRQALTPLVVGLVIGLVASLAVNRALMSTLVEVSPSDPVALIAAAGLLMMAGLLGCVVPARRALRLDPLVVLRNE